MKAPNFTAAIELEPDIKRNQIGWCQIYSVGSPGSPDAEGWSIYPTPTSATAWNVQFLSPSIPVLGFLGKRIEMYKAKKLIGFVTLIDEVLND